MRFPWQRVVRDEPPAEELDITDITVDGILYQQMLNALTSVEGWLRGRDRPTPQWSEHRWFVEYLEAQSYWSNLRQSMTRDFFADPAVHARLNAAMHDAARIADICLRHVLTLPPPDMP